MGTSGARCPRTGGHTLEGPAPDHPSFRALRLGAPKTDGLAAVTTGACPRKWGPWSVWKTEVLLHTYLQRFVSASQKAPHRTFIDAFAGQSRNIERATGRPLPTSSRLALDVTPAFSHVLLFELPENARDLEAALAQEYPGREVRVFAGDCNQELGPALEWWAGLGKEGRTGPHLGPTLAYLDPDGLQLDWKTVETLALFCTRRDREGQFIRRHCIELLILFPTGPLRRLLPQPPKKEAGHRVTEQVDRLFGTDEWRRIYRDQRAGVIRGEESWIPYVDLYRHRLLTLGYKEVRGIEVRNTKNVVLYHLIFATQHPVGVRIMDSIFQRAGEVLPLLIDQERRRRASEDQSSPPLFTEDEEALDQMAAAPDRFAKVLPKQPVLYEPGAWDAQQRLWQ